jgi:vacuolar-type H+-ATPase subunit H
MRQSRLGRLNRPGGFSLKGNNVMHEVIQIVMATEAEAKRLVQAAKAEGERIRSEARKRAQESTATAREEAQIEAGKILALAAKNSAADKQVRLAAAKVEIERQIILGGPARRQAVNAVVRCVCG